MEVFYVKVYRLKNKFFRHEFYYYTDLRFNKDLPCVDAAAIYAWTIGKEYNAIHMKF